MKNQKNRIQVYLLIAFGMITFFASSCENEDITVKKDPIITWSSPSDINEGTLLSATQLNATADVAGTFVYTPTVGTSLNVGANQDLKVDFTPSDSIKYNVVSKTVKINVIEKTEPIITWAYPADILGGTALSAIQLNATADVAGTFVYTPPIGTTLSVGANQDLKVDFTPTDLFAYNVISKTVIINVIANTTPSNIQMVNIPAGTFTMGSPTNEVNRSSNETQFQVTLTAFRMSKYEITNAQYAAFLNAKKIGRNGKYPEGSYPDQALIYESSVLIYPNSGSCDWGLYYHSNKWKPVAGYENHPVIYVTWYGAVEFATYVGGTIPTEAQWEYACRAGTTTAFNTGDFLTNLQANYDWASPYNGGTNTVTSYLGKTQAVGAYSANAWGLHDMHGNVGEWCSDWYGTYPTTAQTNPTGAASGSKRVYRGGGCFSTADICRSANRYIRTPNYHYFNLGFRVVLAP